MVQDTPGDLVGGTALCMHLQHRKSYDLDYMTHESFSGLELFEAFKQTAESVSVTNVGFDQCNLFVNNVKVDIFLTPSRGDNPGYTKQLDKAIPMAGLNVSSLSDLLAIKLDIIMYRPKLRDYLDIMAIDKSGVFRIEDGLRMHCERYGTPDPGRTLTRIVDYLQTSGELQLDSMFAYQELEVQEYFAERIPALRNYVAAIRHGLTDVAISTDPRVDTIQAYYDEISQGPTLRERIIHTLRADRQSSRARIASRLGCSVGYVSQIAREINLR